MKTNIFMSYTVAIKQMICGNLLSKIILNKNIPKNNNLLCLDEREKLNKVLKYVYT